MKKTVCGVYCNECHAYKVECEGCETLKGCISWAKFLDLTVCPIYTCVLEKGYADCGDCPVLPCKIWMVDTKIPEMSEEEYLADVKQRIAVLKNGREDRI